MARTYLKQAPGAAKPASGSPAGVPDIVRGVIDSIRAEGDAAVRRYSEKFDKWSPDSFRLSEEQIQHAIAQVPAQTIADIKEVQANVRAFAIAQRESIKDFEIETAPGVFLGQRNNPINCVGA
jgi:histidinol dehydrogenase